MYRSYSTLPEAIGSLIEARRWADLGAGDFAWPESNIIAPELTDTLLSLPKLDRVLLFRALPKRISTEVFASLSGESRQMLLQELSDAETRHLLATISPDDRTHLLCEMPGQVTQSLMNMLSPEDLEESRQLLGYAQDSVGRLMTPDYLAVKPDWTVQEALEHIRKRGHESETADVIYVVDPAWKLLDALSLRRFVMAAPDSSVQSIMDNLFVAIEASEDRREAVQRIGRYDLAALPVVDSSGVLIGIVTIDDVLDVAEAEATEDFHRVGGVEPLRTSYFEASKWLLYRRRIGWLAILVFVNLISSGVIAAFEEVLDAVVTLAFFIPLIIDTGGNTGSQSAMLMVRAISTGDVKLGQWLRVVAKEAVIGLALGLSLGVLGFALGAFRGGYEIGLVVFCTMITMLLLTNLVGVVLPFILTRFRLDPAIASGPLITSVADAVGLLIYFSFASWILGIRPG